MASGMHVEIEGFKNGGKIPRRHSGAGDNISPEVRWSDLPPRTRELAVIVEDVDAKGRSGKPFVHWVACGIPATTKRLPEGVPTSPEVSGPPKLIQGHNDFGEVGYGGPLPPEGSGPHHYHFHVYALDANLPVDPNLNAEDLKAEMRGHILEEAEYVGTFETPAPALSR
jgi:Raf kinase inhibitor-like YbhB/YbcL family protein